MSATPPRHDGVSIAHETFLEALDATLAEMTDIDALRLGEMLRELYLLTATHPAVVNWLNQWVIDVINRKHGVQP